MEALIDCSVLARLSGRHRILTVCQNEGLVLKTLVEKDPDGVDLKKQIAPLCISWGLALFRFRLSQIPWLVFGQVTVIITIPNSQLYDLLPFL